jgi:hypothetical protein
MTTPDADVPAMVAWYSIRVLGLSWWIPRGSVGMLAEIDAD